MKTQRQIVEERLAELRDEYKALYEQRGALIDRATEEKRGLTADEQTTYEDLTGRRNAIGSEITPVEERLAEITDNEQREARAAACRAMSGMGGPLTSDAHVTDPPVYLPGNVTGNSFLRDLGKRALDPLGAQDATDRLVRSARAAADEKRALGNTNATGGSGGEFAPPEWLVGEWINLLRPGRVTAGLYTQAMVPPGVSSINIPKLLTGSAVAIQSTQVTQLPETDITTAFVGTGFTTIGGKQVVSQQLLDQSAIPFDRIISTDLAAAYNTYFGQQVILGAGTGANNNSVLNGLVNAPTVAANQATLAASPTAQTFYSKASGMLASFATTRYDKPELWLMHPRRWYWLTSLFDSAGRPLVVPNGVAYNPIAQDSPGVAVAGSVGTFLSLPVVIDPNLPTNLGTATNQDEVFLMKASDLWLFESAPRAEAFREPYADSLGVLYRLYTYSGTIVNRLNSSIATMNGPGLTPPAF